jgi:fluoride exporter
MFKTIMMIGIGGFLGTIARYLTTLSVHRYLPISFPYGTFFVNILGCFLIGIFYGLSEKGSMIPDDWRLFLTVGFCGGFTTFSTFANDNLSLLQDSEFFNFALYTGLSVFLGLVAAYFGKVIIKMV